MSQVPHPSMQQRQFSPPQNSPSSTTANGAFALPPNKRTKMSPGLSPQPGSPYAHSPYTGATSPPATTPGAATPTNGHASPTLPTNMNMSTMSQAPHNSYNPSLQQNGRSTPALTMPTPTPTAPTPPAHSPRLSTPTITHVPPPAPYSTATLAPVGMPLATPGIGNMGPPTIAPSSFSMSDAARHAAKPAPTKTTAYDMDDMLMGTGIDLEEEADYLNNLETRTAGGRDSFYGAGPANQPAQHTGAKSQAELEAETADMAWNAAARRLAMSRSHEMAHHLLDPGLVHRRLNDVAKKFGLELNLDMRPDGKTQYMGKLATAADFPKPEIKLMTQKVPDGTVVQTLGSFIPKESFLVDQIALLSIGTKERLKDLLGDAHKIATTRQLSSHGAVPAEWAEAAAHPSPKVNGTAGDGQRTGAESAVSPRTNPLKRPADELSNGLLTPVSELPPANFMVEALLTAGKATQNAEERRLRKRQKRLEKAAEKESQTGDAGSRTGSVAPGTPGAIAPEQAESKPTKKESKKAAAKASEEQSSTSVNNTLSQFIGGKKKKYSWMTGGSGGVTGASTPRAQAAPGTPRGMGGATGKAARGALTKGSVSHLGQFREDSEKGKNIQLRDWIVVLEDHGFDKKTLQEAYVRVDKSDTGDKVATGKAP
ncbi:Uu.00g068660.m01.CDS01 [Anthostomella pinea]|uniref:Transcription initiation factor TFIID subunit 4 n=1 Tax=Anthostomella pinea TaxID=933095 RepID=A0AAI8YNL7_9PEZI|nr:Uu.00g068660.m01.CDS01 [Anthostomella pinea]